MENKAVPIFKQAVDKDPELFIETWVQIPSAMYMMREAIVRFNTQLAKISDFAGS
jgi:hypothetical protein